MTLQEIKAAVDAGHAVHWSNTDYRVIKDSLGRYLIGWNIGGKGENYHSLTHTDGVTMNGEPAEFFLGCGPRPLCEETIEHAGYIVHDNECIHTIGATADEAWGAFVAEMRSQGITLVADGDDPPESDEDWTRERYFHIRSASADLLAQVREHGGNRPWRLHNGIACTFED